jgi:hypothetical protein
VIPLARKRVISELAEYTANLYFPDKTIIPETIAVDNDISFNYGHYGNYFDGLLEQAQGRFHIFINLDKVKHSNSPRSRFTFAHELGHYFLDEHRRALLAGKVPSHPSITDFSSRNLIEQEADYFAGSLLMPHTRFLRDCRSIPVSSDLIQGLASQYQTSLAATLLRYASVGHHPIVVVCSQNGKVLWHYKSDDFEFKYLKLVNGRTPNSTATGEYFSKGKKYLAPEVIFAEDWFDYVEYKRNTFKIKEQCFYFDSVAMALTMIWCN